MTSSENRYGLVACGGESERMGSDKGLLTYHNKPQRYHAYDLLSPLCEKTFLSCNELQASDVQPGYQVLKDAVQYRDIGPMAALLTAFQKFPEKNFLIIGCDYPFLTAGELNSFSNFCEQNQRAAAFYDQSLQLYEPLLAWYPAETYDLLLSQFKKGDHSLQHFLRQIDAAKYLPSDAMTMNSIDIPEAHVSAKVRIRAGEPITE